MYYTYAGSFFVLCRIYLWTIIKFKGYFIVEYFIIDPFDNSGTLTFLKPPLNLILYQELKTIMYHGLNITMELPFDVAGTGDAEPRETAV